MKVIIPDYAIEHGGYLADAAEQYMKARNAFDEAESTDGCDTADHDLLSDHWRALENAIGEFRKRARRTVETPTNCTCNSDSVYCPFHKRDVKPISLNLESGAAQEVSPPSPEPVCPMCCKPVFTDGYEGDTRELKAALRECAGLLKSAANAIDRGNLHGPIWSGRSQQIIAEAERLLGEYPKE